MDEMEINEVGTYLPRAPFAERNQRHRGTPGTGKSRVVNAPREFFGLRNQRRRFRLAAYTGVAARNIGGATLHSLLQMNDTGRELSAGTNRELAAMC